VDVCTVGTLRGVDGVAEAGTLTFFFSSVRFLTGGIFHQLLEFY
jgi:hypothetical protein